MTQDHEIALRQRHDRNLGVDRRVNNARGARTKAFAIGQHAQFAQGRAHVKRFALDRRQDQIARFEQTGLSQIFLRGAHHDVIDAGGCGAARAAETRRSTGLGLQLERDVLQNMSSPGALFQASHKAARLFIAAFVLTQAGQPFDQARHEARQ